MVPVRKDHHELSWVLHHLSYRNSRVLQYVGGYQSSFMPQKILAHFLAIMKLEAAEPFELLSVFGVNAVPELGFPKVQEVY